MSEIPALRDALVDAAARRARRRRRLALRAVAWTAAAAAAAALLALAVSGPRDREVPAVPPPQDVVRGYSAFDRPAAAADTPPAGALSADYTRVESRLVLDEDGTRVWLAVGERPKVEGFGGRSELCAVVRGAAGAGGVCGGPVSEGFASQLLRRDGPDPVLFVLPDGARDPQVLTRDGIVSPAVHDNVALAVPGEPAIGASFTDASGVRRIARYRELHARGWTPPAGCPRLDPLPASAGNLAERAALLAVDRLYPWIQEARVTRVSPVQPGLCPREVTDRSLLVELRILPFDASQRASDSLTQGRVLVGMEGGEMTVWRVQH
jgi:hypothetical protein